ncbi:MAG: hypothetical protein GY756_26945 [bacterium]|nr:hypothetical protein [bacterium]
MIKGFEIVLNGVTYSEGFDWKTNPSIEIKRNTAERAIYENPSFDFTAYGTLRQDIENIVFSNPLCKSLDIEILKNGVVIWNGRIKTSDFNTVLNSPEKGTYTEIEVIDRNYKSYFKPLAKVPIDIQSLLDRNCEITTWRPTPININFYQFVSVFPTTPYPRKTFTVYNLLKKVVLDVTNGEATFESDYFESGEGENLVIALGDWITNEHPKNNMAISWEQLTSDLFKYLNLFVKYYSIEDEQYVRIEPYDYFYDDGTTFLIEDASNVQQTTQIDKLVSSVSIGDPSPLDNYEKAFETFEYSSFEKQIIGVENDCTFENELSLVGTTLIVNSDKIRYTLTQGLVSVPEDADDQFREKFFLVQTDGTDATVFELGTSKYYNDLFLNSQILRRYFDGSTPISVYPEIIEGVDYFSVASSAELDTGILVGSVPAVHTLNNLWYFGENVLIDNNSTITDNYAVNIVNGGFENGTQRTRFTAGQLNTYSFEFDFEVAFFGGATIPPGEVSEIRIGLLVYDISAGLSSYYYSDYVEVPFIEGYRSLSHTTDTIFMDVGDYAYCWIESKGIIAVGGAINWGYNTNSKWLISTCKSFQADFVEGSKKRLVFETTFKDYPISEDDFNSIRLNPEQKIKVTSNKYLQNGYIEGFKFDYETKQTAIILASAKGFEINTDAVSASDVRVFDYTFSEEFS